MKRDRQTAAEIRDGVLRGRSRAIEAMRDWIAAMVYGAGWGISDPEAAIQEVTLRVLHLAKSGRIRTDTDFKGFVLTVARHECTDIYRREKLRAAVETRGAEAEYRSASGGDPYQRLEEKERRELLKFIFQALPEDCRRLWRWLYREGLASTEVAQRLGISAVNARVRVHRCLQKARKVRETYVLDSPGPARAGEHV
jgi:RNA polymerase sigma factor (sigma-70 family)